MNKLFATLFSTLLLSGCLYQTINNYDIERASLACGGIHNIVVIASYFTGDVGVQCKFKNRILLDHISNKAP